MTNPLPVLKDDELFRITATGYYTNNSTAPSSPTVVFRAETDWNSTTQPTYIEIGTRDSAGTAHNILIRGNGSIEIGYLAGGGVGYVCKDNNGKIYGGSPGC